jgi:hypothetical protein
MTPSSLISSAETVLLQGNALLRTVSYEDYARKHGGPAGASIGAHYRHVLDHFFCLIEGLWDLEINYDERSRNPELEQSAEAALVATQDLIVALRAIPMEVLERECTVVYCVGYGESSAEGVASNVAREVMFCVGHAIHHYAILKLLCTVAGVELPYEFGVAPSTLKHLEAAARA